MSYTVVLFRDGHEVGIVADGVEVLEDTENQVVLTATFEIIPEVEDILAEANDLLESDGIGEGIGAAEGHVVGHSG